MGLKNLRYLATTKMVPTVILPTAKCPTQHPEGGDPRFVGTIVVAEHNKVDFARK
ncbi:hypothetical protein HYV84_06445 [Candidatus Woesearchaeota archaeon]|nr:hypothetical protein [Candidatus Woesearchaeota archaeon]